MNHVTTVSRIRASVAAVLITVPALVTVSHVASAIAARWKVYAATMVMMLKATQMTVSDSIRQ